jgi:hypothetical protein
MTIWAERIVDIGDWERVQNLFEENFKALKGPREMMLICLDDDHRTARFVAAFPDGAPLSLYEGLVVAQNEVPPLHCTLSSRNTGGGVGFGRSGSKRHRAVLTSPLIFS